MYEHKENFQSMQGGDANRNIVTHLTDTRHVDTLTEFSHWFCGPGEANDVASSESSCHLVLWVIGSCVTVCTFFLFWRKWLNKATVCTCEGDGERKIVIITGALGGLGQETARQLAMKGAWVILACRDVHLGEQVAERIKTETDNPFVFARLLDLSSTQSIKEFVRNITNNEQRVDVLINNAAIINPKSPYTLEGHDTTFMVNYLGHFLLTHLLTDILVTSAPSRVINVTSHEHVLATVSGVTELFVPHSRSPYDVYCCSKLAQIIYTRELARRLEGTGVTCYAVHPGLLNTGLRHNLVIYTLPVVGWLVRGLQTLLLKSAMDGTHTLLHCALSTELTNQSGRYYSNCAESTPSVSAMSGELAEQLWNESERALRIQAREEGQCG